MRQRVLGGRGYRMPALQQVLVSLASATEVNIRNIDRDFSRKPESTHGTDWFPAPRTFSRHRDAYNPALRRYRMAERKGCPPPLSQEGILCFNVLTGDYVCNS